MEKKRTTRQCSENTLHIVLYLPINVNITATAAAAAATRTLQWRCPSTAGIIAEEAITGASS